MGRTAIYHGFISILFRGNPGDYEPLPPRGFHKVVYVGDEYDGLEIVLYKEYIKIGSEFFSIPMYQGPRVFNYPRDLTLYKIDCYDILSYDPSMPYKEVVIRKESDIIEKPIIDVNTLEWNYSGELRVGVDGKLCYYSPNTEGELLRISGMYVNDGSIGVKYPYLQGRYILMDNDTIATIVDSIMASNKSIECRMCDYGLKDIVGVYRSSYDIYVHTSDGTVHYGVLTRPLEVLITNVLSTTSDIPHRKVSIKGSHTMSE